MKVNNFQAIIRISIMTPKKKLLNKMLILFQKDQNQ